MAWHCWQGDALLLELAIQPGAAKSHISGLHGERLKIRIQAPPVDGKANAELTKFLADAFDTPRSRIKILRGENSRTKTVRIDRPVSCPATLTALGLVSVA